MKTRVAPAILSPVRRAKRAAHSPGPRAAVFRPCWDGRFCSRNFMKTRVTPAVSPPVRRAKRAAAQPRPLTPGPCFSTLLGWESPPAKLHEKTGGVTPAVLPPVRRAKRAAHNPGPRAAVLRPGPQALPKASHDGAEFIPISASEKGFAALARSAGMRSHDWPASRWKTRVAASRFHSKSKAAQPAPPPFGSRHRSQKQRSDLPADPALQPEDW